jgi:hypothetical protein
VNVNGVPAKVSVVLKLFLTLISLVAPVLPTKVAAKVTAAGATDTCGTPVPERVTCCGLFPASSVMSRVADLGPSAPGVKVTLTMHDWFTASVLLQVVVVFRKSLALVPVIAMEAMLIVPPVWLVRVTFLAKLVVPIA